MIEPMEVDVAVTCICGDPQCDNSLERRELQNLPLYTRQHKRRLHGALQSADCASVCQLLQSGMQFCTAGEDNCFVHIVKHCKASFLDSALEMQPDAVNCRGEHGYTLLMLCDDVEKMQVILSHGPDLQAVNDLGENVLLHYVKHRLKDVAQKLVDYYATLFNNPVNWSVEEFHAIRDRSKAMLECIVQSGVNINAEDKDGYAAVTEVFDIFNCGYVFHEYHASEFLGEKQHVYPVCELENEIAAHALYTILQAEPIIAPPDENGVTELMLACLSPWNLDSIKLLVERGEDVNAKDDEGRNAIHYLLESFMYHCCHLECIQLDQDKAPVVDQFLCFLLDHGCELQGTDIKLFYLAKYEEDDEVPVLKHLMSIKDSCLYKRDFAEKQQIKNDTDTCSFLELFLRHRECLDQENPMKLDLKDVGVLAKEISEGLDARQRLVEPWDFFNEVSDWSERLLVPDVLRKVLFMQTMDAVPDLPGRRIHPGKKYFKALDGVQRLLLPFWPYSPLALLIFLPCYVDDEFAPAVGRCRKLVYLLHDIGGPLTPGSQLYRATRQALESAVGKTAGLQVALQAFDQLHEKIPSLLQLSRTALRASLKNVDTEGLDVSTLKVLCQGELTSLPAPIRKYLNFGKLPAKPAVGAEDTQAS